jgi:hypothetical protein
MAVSIDPVLAKCSAVSSSWATLLHRVFEFEEDKGENAGSCCWSGDEAGRVAFGDTMFVVIKVGTGRRTCVDDSGIDRDRDGLLAELAIDRLELTLRMRSLVMGCDGQEGVDVVDIDVYGIEGIEELG